MSSSNYNPDVLSCIANLSSDAIHIAGPALRGHLSDVAGIAAMTSSASLAATTTRIS